MINKFKDEIKIPIELDNAVLKGFEKGRHQKAKLKSKRIKRVSIAAGITLISAAVIGISTPKFASAVTNIFNNFIADGYHAQGYNKISQTIHVPSSTKNDVTVTLNKVSVDNNILAAVFNIKSDRLKDAYSIDMFMPHINLGEEEAQVYETTCKMLSKNEAVIMVKAIPPHLASRTNIKFYAELSNTSIAKHNIEGPWKFSTTISKAVDEKVYNSNSIIKYPDKEININKLSISPLGNLLYIDTTYYNGNKYVLYSGNFNYVIRDDKGNDLLYTTEHGFRQDKTDHMMMNILGSLKGTKYIDIIKATGNNSIYTSTNDGNQPLYNTIGEDSKKKKQLISRQANQYEVSEVSPLKRINYYLNTDKETFYTPNELIGKEIKINNSNAVTITNVQDLNNGIFKFTMKMKGSCELLNPILFDSSLKDLNFENMVSNGICVEDPDNKVISFTLKGIDKNKKYTIALPMKSDVTVDESSKVRVYLNK